MSGSTTKTDITRSTRILRRLKDVPGLKEEEKQELDAVVKEYPFQASEYYLSLIDWDDPNDPIRRIVIPDISELKEGGDLDASDEESNYEAPGVQHKYPHTALLLCTDFCDSLCRYCFRKRLFREPSNEIARNVDEGIEYIRQTERITNVLLTGGDPLMMPTTRLVDIFEKLREIPHVGIIRIGTKTPAFRPQRIIGDPKLIEAFEKYSTPQKRIYIIAHYDHPRELTDVSIEALDLMLRSGVHIINQNPLLAGINDDPKVLVELYRKIARIGVCPYYLFICRPTSGNEDFKVPIVRSYFILEEAKRHLCGLDKRVRLVMSHASGKIEVVGVDESNMYLRYHRARNPENEGKFMVFPRDDEACWFDDLTGEQAGESAMPVTVAFGGACGVNGDG